MFDADADLRAHPLDVFRRSDTASVRQRTRSAIENGNVPADRGERRTAKEAAATNKSPAATTATGARFEQIANAGQQVASRASDARRCANRATC